MRPSEAAHLTISGTLPAADPVASVAVGGCDDPEDSALDMAVTQGGRGSWLFAVGVLEAVVQHDSDASDVDVIAQ